MKISKPKLQTAAKTRWPTARVAVLVDIDDTWGRNVVEAISRYATEAGWQLLIAPRDSQRRLRLPNNWCGDGAIVMLRDRSLLDHVKQANMSVVNVSGMFLGEGWAGHVATDDIGRARMAFQHFRGRQIKNFASYSPRIGRYTDQREAAFSRTVEKEEFRCDCYRSDLAGENTDWLIDREGVGRWLESLPKPVGVFAADPYPARQLVEICSWRELDVPGNVAIISGDEDDLLCKSVTPPITSVELASHRIGWEASAMLKSMMRTNRVPTEPMLIQPLRVCLRRSTESLSVSDPVLALVVQAIWERSPDKLEVRDLVRVACMSRRSLEQRFREFLGRTPAEEIRRIRLEKSRQMIVTTSLSVASIAHACGFSSGPYLTHAFRRQFGVTPSELRLGRK
jgi:LacI family transcriptional regulator